MPSIGCDGDCVQYIPPSNETGTDEFDYTAKDTNDNTDTATVSVDVNKDSCNDGSISVSVQDQSGSSVNTEAIDVKYDDTRRYIGSGPSAETSVELFDGGRDALIQPEYISPPEGYKVKESNWIDKKEAEPTYEVDWRSELGF